MDLIKSNGKTINYVMLVSVEQCIKKNENSDTFMYEQHWRTVNLYARFRFILLQRFSRTNIILSDAEP